MCTKHKFILVRLLYDYILVLFHSIDVEQIRCEKINSLIVKMANDISNAKSICILAVVVVCFAVLWPTIFYPMLRGAVSDSSDDVNGCCDVLTYKDVNVVRLVAELCGKVLQQPKVYDSALYFQTDHLNKDNIKRCQDTILETCDVDVHVLLKDKIQLTPNYKQVLENMRNINNSLCLKYHFDVDLDLLGVPHRIKPYKPITTSPYQRQERSPYKIREPLTHPAFRERGRAVPEAHTFPHTSRSEPDHPPPILTESSHKPPIPGMRPPMGGSRVVPQQKGSGIVGVLLPVYTMGIVIFFGYTIVKLLFKNEGGVEAVDKKYKDDEFKQYVFAGNNCCSSTDFRGTSKPVNNKPEPQPKLGDVEIEQLRRRLAETEATMERIMRQMNLVSESLTRPSLENEKSREDEIAQKSTTNGLEFKTDTIDEEKENQEEQKTILQKCDHDQSDGNLNENENAILNGSVEVVGLEMTESVEGGKPWTRPTTPPRVSASVSSIPAQEILLPGTIPANSQLFISDTKTESIASTPSIILESKLTLNVIPLQGETNNENSDEVADESKFNGTWNGSHVTINNDANGKNEAANTDGNSTDEESEEANNVDEMITEEEEVDDENDENIKNEENDENKSNGLKHTEL